MPNIGTLLRAEITRLSRKESRGQVDQMRKATTQHRKDIAGLKRQVAQLERQVKLLSRRAPSASRAVATETTPGAKVRFAAKGLKSQRDRLGLSAAEFGRLIGVSAQSVYNWEGGQTRPRDAQIARLVSLRALGKREASRRLEQLDGRSARRTSSTP